MSRNSILLMISLLEQLNEFLGKAALATYAGGGAPLSPTETEKGMIEFEYGNKGDEWYYKDSYAGFYQSWGREVVWYAGKPFWVQLYGGSMKEEFHNDLAFTRKTFTFLKQALSAGEKVTSFQPRGPKKFNDGDWEYICDWEGDITKFNGSEKILYKENVIFTYNFNGGLFLLL